MDDSYAYRIYVELAKHIVLIYLNIDWWFNKTLWKKCFQMILKLWKVIVRLKDRIKRRGKNRRRQEKVWRRKEDEGGKWHSRVWKKWNRRKELNKIGI